MNKSPGQKHLQNMMAQSQKQMANQQKQMRQAAWWQKQQEKDWPQDENEGGSASSTPTTKWQGTGHFQPDERFRKVEAEVAKLKKQLDTGRLSEQKFKEQLNNLMVQDDNGDWWMIGTKTNAWFRYNGQNWVQSTPPGRWVQENSPALNTKTSLSKEKIKKGHPVRAIFVFFFLLAIFAVIGWLAGWIGIEALDFSAWIPLGDVSIPLLSGIVWVIGLIVTFRSARRTWRGR